MVLGIKGLRKIKDCELPAAKSLRPSTNKIPSLLTRMSLFDSGFYPGSIRNVDVM